MSSRVFPLTVRGKRARIGEVRGDSVWEEGGGATGQPEKGGKTGKRREALATALYPVPSLSLLGTRKGGKKTRRGTEAGGMVLGSTRKINES